MIGPERTDETFLADAAAQAWSAILIRASTACPENIDAILAKANPLAQSQKGHAQFVELDALPVARDLKDTDRPAIGVLLDDSKARIDDAQASAMATRFAALAVEKECEIVILTHQDNAGFERFGFRVERISGKTKAERDACVAQIRRFWGIDILI